MRFLVISVCLFFFNLIPLFAQEVRPILFGHNDAMLYGRHWSDSEKGRNGKDEKQIMPDVFQVCKAYPALLSTDLDGLELGRKVYWGGVTFEQMRNSIIIQHRSGGKVTISWHVRNPEHGRTYLFKSENAGTVSRILKREGKVYETFTLYLKRIADFLLSLRDDEGKLIPIIFRPWHECNGNWFWWGTADCSPEEYIALWRLTHEYFREQGLTNLSYAFSPGSWFRDEEEYMLRFPGHEYVDIIGIECYRPENVSIEEGRMLFRNHMQKNLRIAKSIADSLKLPYAITETGMQPNSDPQWWTMGLMPAMQGYEPMYVTFWSNQWDAISEGRSWCTYPGEASAKDFRKFYRKNKKSFIKKLKWD